MEQHTLGQLQVSAVGLGCNNFGTRLDAAGTKLVVDAAIDAGINYFDTAEMYGRGKVEDLVGEALHDLRDQLFLVSKVLPSNSSYDGTLSACERSLSRLRTDYLDCYLLHWRGAYPLEETVRALNKLQEQGMIRSWGVSNFDVSDMEELFQTPGGDRAVCNQVLYHLGARYIEQALIPWCQARNVAIVAYSPFGSGRFPKLPPQLAQIGPSERATALSFLARHEGTFVIPKASKIVHVEDNAKITELHPEQIEAFDRAFALQPTEGLPTI